MYAVKVDESGVGSFSDVAGEIIWAADENKEAINMRASAAITQIQCRTP